MASILGGFKNALSLLTGKGKDESVLGIDIGSSSIKLVQLRASQGSAVLETYGEIALGPYGDMPVGKTVKLSVDKVATALSDLMKEANVTATHAGISIPFSSSLISVLDLPKVDKSQLKRMIPIEARKYIPLPISEVTLDWFIIPEEEKEKDAFDRIEKETVMQKKGQEVLLVAIHNEVLQAYSTIMSTTGLSASFFEIEIFSSTRSSLGHSPAPVAVIDIGASSTKIYVVERGVVRLAHLLNIGAQQMTEILARSLDWTFEKAERMKRETGLNESPTYSREENEKMRQAITSPLSRIFSEANRVLVTFGKRYNKNVNKLVLIGGGASMPNLAPFAKESAHVDIVVANPFSKVETPAFLEEVLTNIGPSFATAVGVALRKLAQN
jgi:type IV pilus assembly protein PilM